VVTEERATRGGCIREKGAELRTSVHVRTYGDSTLRTVVLICLSGCRVNESGLGTSQIHEPTDGGAAKDGTFGAAQAGRDGELDVGRIVTPDLPINAGGGGETGAGATFRAEDSGSRSENEGAAGRDGGATPDEKMVLSTGIPDVNHIDAAGVAASDGAIIAAVPTGTGRMADAGYVDAGGTSGTVGQTGTGGTTSCALDQFQAPERLTGLGPSGSNLYGPSLSADGKLLYFAARYSSNGSGEDIYTARRTEGSSFSSVESLDSVNTAYDDGTPSISADGLTLYFYSKRPGGKGGRDLWMTSRPTLQGSFGGEKPLAAINSSDDDHVPWVSADELTILWGSERGGSPDLYISTRSSKSEDFANPAVLGGVNGSSSREDRAALSRDGLTIYFISNRAGTLGDLDIWTATRSRSDVAFSGITNLKVVNTANSDIDVALSADETELFFSSNRAGQYDLYRSVRKCK